jgi:hypothetical protein
METVTNAVLLISACADAIGAIYRNRVEIERGLIVVVNIWKRTWHRFRGTVLPIPDDALAY